MNHIANVIKNMASCFAVTVMMLSSAAAQDAGKYLSGETTVIRFEGRQPIGNFLTVDLMARVSDGEDCDKLASGVAWERLCEFGEKSGTTILIGNLVSVLNSTNVYEGRIIEPSGDFWLVARVAIDQNGYFIRLKMPDGVYGPPININGSRNQAVPALGRINAATARHFIQGASFELTVGTREGQGRTAQLDVDVTSDDACAALTPQKRGWQLLCEIAVKSGQKQSFSGNLPNIGSVNAGVVESADGAQFRLWVRDPRDGYAMVAVRELAEAEFKQGQPLEAVIFNGPAIGITPPVAPPAPLPAGGTPFAEARLVGVNMLSKIELNTPNNGQVPVRLTLNVGVRREADGDECMRLMGMANQPQSVIASICERAEKAGPLTMIGVLESMPNRRNALWGSVTDNLNNSYRMMVTNIRSDYAEIAFVSENDPEFVKEIYALIPYDGSPADEEMQKPNIALDGNWQIDFGPIPTFSLSGTDNDRFIGTMNFPAYSGQDCVTRGGGVARRICESADKDGARSYQLSGERRSGPWIAWDFTADFPGGSGFEIALGSSIRDTNGLESTALYLRFGELSFEPDSNRPWHKILPASQTRGEQTSDPLFNAQLGRVPTCSDMEAKLASMQTRVAEFITPLNPTPLNEAEYAVETALRDIKNGVGSTSAVEYCARTYDYLVDLLANLEALNQTPDAQTSLSLKSVGGRMVLLVPPQFCDSYKATAFCSAVNAGPSEGFPIEDFASAPSIAWGTANINGVRFSMRVKSDQSLGFEFYSANGAERF